MYIYLSENRMDAPALEIARTILHESFHAYMYGKIYDSSGNYEGVFPEPNFNAEWKMYEKRFPEASGSNSQGHNYMATMYIDFIKDGLIKYFNSDPLLAKYANDNSTNSYWDLESMCEYLSWGGLRGTDSYDDFICEYPNKVHEWDTLNSMFLWSPDFPKICE